MRRRWRQRGGDGHASDATVLVPPTHVMDTTGEGPLTSVWLNGLLSRLRLEREEGQGLVEYALIIAVIAIGGYAAYRFLGTSASAHASDLGSGISGG